MNFVRTSMKFDPLVSNLARIETMKTNLFKKMSDLGGHIG